MGPRCTSCNHMVEWTCWEIDEEICAPKTYCCASCFAFFTVQIEVIEEIQKSAREFYFCGETVFRETEEDWKKAREDYESGNY